MTTMKIYENGLNWIIEDQLDETIVEKISNLINDNLNDFLNLKEGFSTKGKNSKQYWLRKPNEDYYYRSKNFENIEKQYKLQILNRLKISGVLKPKILKNIDIKSDSCWTVIGEENSYHTPHFHSDGDGRTISTILYLRVPETNIEDEPDNNLYLIMNSGPNTRLYLNNPKYFIISPEVGKMLIFPDWIIHGTCPQSKGIRQTFNMDYSFIKQNNSIIKYN